MASEVLHGVVGPGFVPVGVGDQGARVVGNDELGLSAGPNNVKEMMGIP